jgi:hypothetical protein
VIDFRYHLVSIVAVFLALAIGIVLGSTELQGNTLDALRSASNSLKNQLDKDDAEIAGYEQQASASDTFLQTAEPKLLDAMLAGDQIVIVTEPGASSGVISGIERAAGDAGATITGMVSLQPKFNDLSGTTQSRLSAINNELASYDGTPLAAATNEQTVNEQQAAQLIATAILNKTQGQAGLTVPAAKLLLGAYAQAGFLTVSSGDPTDRATLAVLVTPQTAPADGPNDPANQVLLAVAAQFAEQSAATLVAGSVAGSAPADSAISVLRGSGVSGQVSSVDNADTLLGQISTIWALANQLAGGKPGSYGVSGAAAVSPGPGPAPSATPSVTQTVPNTPTPKATGKVKKPVKKK